MARVIRETKSPRKQFPKVVVEDEAELVLLRLVKDGYARSYKEALELDVRTVLKINAFERFLGDYEDEYIELNKKKDL